MPSIIKGFVQKVLFSKKENDYYVFTLQTGTDAITASINFPNITVGFNAEFHG